MAATRKSRRQCTIFPVASICSKFNKKTDATNGLECAQLNVVCSNETARSYRAHKKTALFKDYERSLGNPNDTR